MDKQPLYSAKIPVRCSHDQTCYRSNTFKSATDGILPENSVHRKNTFSVVLLLQLCNFTQRVYYTIGLKQSTYFNNDDPNFFLDLFAVLDNMQNLNSSRLIVAGDCNFCLGPLDYKVSQSHHSNVNSKNIFDALMDKFNLVDIWRMDHPNVRKYTRHQKNPVALSRLDYIFVSSDLINSVNSSNIISGISSDHSIVAAKISKDVSARGRGYWKLNCHFLRHDAQFIESIKSKITEFKDIHSGSLANPNIIWDTFKCFISGHCIEYTSRKKRERAKAKSDLLDNIDKVKETISEFDEMTAAGPTLDQLVDELQSLEREIWKRLSILKQLG